MAIPVQKVASAGGLPQASTVATYAAPAASETVVPGPSTFLLVRVGATATTITVDSVAPCSQGVDHDLVAGPITSADRLIGPIPADRFGRASDGLAAVTFSQVVGVTVAAITI